MNLTGVLAYNAVIGPHRSDVYAVIGPPHQVVDRRSESIRELLHFIGTKRFDVARFPFADRARTDADNIAEQNAIISAPRRSMRGATLYLACLDETIDPAPCNICDRMIKNAGITRVVTRAGTF